jgi:RNA polymerase sigma factor (sigma-70 family)
LLGGVIPVSTGAQRGQTLHVNQPDTVGFWLQQAVRIPLLTPAEELHLGAMVREWQDWEGGPDKAAPQVIRRGQRAKERMVEANLRLVVSVSKRYLRRASARGLPHEDLLQEGTLGLNRGCEKFDPSRGYKLSTYLVPWIQQAMGRLLDHEGGPVRLPGQVGSALAQVTSGWVRFEELAPSMQARVSAAAAVRFQARLDGRIGDGETTLGELVAAPGNDPLELLDQELLLQQMAASAPQELALLRELQERTPAEVASDLGISRQAVNVRVHKARRRLAELGR